MAGGGVTYDAGALIAFERGDGPATSLHRRYVQRGVVPVVPAAVLAQVWRDPARQARLALVLRGCRVESLDELQARRIGVLARVTATADVVDLSVAEGALRRGDVVLSSDPGDLVACGVPSDAIVVV
jgi:hypothetical protein